MSEIDNGDSREFFISQEFLTAVVSEPDISTGVYPMVAVRNIDPRSRYCMVWNRETSEWVDAVISKESRGMISSEYENWKRCLGSTDKECR